MKLPAVKIANRLNFNGCIVTTDALITQKKFANAVINSQGHYCLAVKGNHQRLAEAIETTFERAKVIEANPRQQNIKIPGLGSWINRSIRQKLNLLTDVLSRGPLKCCQLI